MAKEITFTPATKEQSRGRVFIFGPSGSGKTYTGLLATFGLAGATTLEECADEKWRDVVAVIDSQRGQAAKYSHLFHFSHYILEPPYHPLHYVNAVKKAEQLGFTHLLVDGITQEWDGEGGVKEIVDKAKGQFGGNSQAAWSVGTPLHNKFFEAIMASGCHIVCTARAKTQWVPGEDSRGRSIFIKVGEAPMQRDTAEYEFDVSLLMDMENAGTISKTHVDPQFPPGMIIEKPGIDNFVGPYLDWLSDGVPTVAPPAPASDTVADAPASDAAPVDVPTPAPEAPMATDDQQNQIIEMIDALQADFGNYSPEMTWWDQFSIRILEWYATADPAKLTQDQAHGLIQKLHTTRSEKVKELAEATT